MEVKFYPGWPFRYAHVIVEGLSSEHALNGLVCLWAEDDPAQVAAIEIEALWHRLDEWAAAAQRGFRVEDRALDACMYFAPHSGYQAELPFGDLVRKGNNGYRAPLVAKKSHSNVVMIELAPSEVEAEGSEVPPLEGAFYLKGQVGSPPRNFDEITATLTRRQRQDLHEGLGRRRGAGFGEPSGGYDFLVFAWPRYDKEHDAIVVGFEGAGDSLRALAMSATPNDTEAKRRRAGPDQAVLKRKRVLIAGAGSVGGQVALTLASSGLGTLRLHDDDSLKSGNLVRHVGPKYLVGFKKTDALSIQIDDHAPWTTVEKGGDLPFDPISLATCIKGFDLVIDCTGNVPLSAALAEVSRKNDTPLITGALFHQGALARVQRQAVGDSLIASRPKNPDYLDLPPENPATPTIRFLELGCTAPVNNAPPIAVLTLAADIASAAVDFLTERRERTDERVLVLRPMPKPFDHLGNLDAPCTKGVTR